MADRPGGLEGAVAERRQARERERVRARRRRIGAWIARFVVLVVVFFVGLAVGKAVQQAPRAGGTQTQVRTFEPATLPAVTRTVTVTTGAP